MKTTINKINSLTLLNLFVEDVQHRLLEEVLKNARYMEQILLNSNANFVVELHNGSAGAQLIFVKTAILDKTKAII